MKYIQVAFENKAIGAALKGEFSKTSKVELVDRAPVVTPALATTIEDYNPTPIPVGIGGPIADPLFTLKDFVLAFVLNGSYDILKFAVIKAASTAWNVSKVASANGIKILTGHSSSRWFSHPKKYNITFSLPFDADAEKLANLLDDVKRLDKALKSFLRRAGKHIIYQKFEFEYKNNSWHLETKISGGHTDSFM